MLRVCWATVIFNAALACASQDEKPLPGGSSGTPGSAGTSNAAPSAGRDAEGGAVSASGGQSGVATGGGAPAGGGTSGALSGGGAATSSAGMTAQTSGGMSGAPNTSMAGALGGGAGGAGGTGGATTSPPCDAKAVVANMRLGWNLGNSLDVTDPSKSDTNVETAWGNPRVTPELLRAVSQAGFGAVRIPVTWIGRFGAAPDYTIRETFFARVEEVVDYALEQGLYAIINIHHDGAEGVTGQWISLVDGAGQVSDANNAAVIQQLKVMWTQIAARFAGYGDHLLFESMNEIKVGYNRPLQAYLDQVNALNQAFVDTVRASTGYNPVRCLVVPGYNTNIDYTVEGFVRPTDTAPGRLILDDHYYDPWNYAGQGSTHAWGAGNPGIDDWGQEDHVRAQVAKLKSRFVDQGLPVIWGEFGAVRQTGYENYRRYYMEYVTKAVHDAGIVPFLWDNGSTGSGEEAFGFINRQTNTAMDPMILEAVIRAVTQDYKLEDVSKP